MHTKGVFVKKRVILFVLSCFLLNFALNLKYLK